MYRTQSVLLPWATAAVHAVTHAGRLPRTTDRFTARMRHESASDGAMPSAGPSSPPYTENQKAVDVLKVTTSYTDASFGLDECRQRSLRSRVTRVNRRSCTDDRNSIPRSPPLTSSLRIILSFRLARSTTTHGSASLRYCQAPASLSCKGASLEPPRTRLQDAPGPGILWAAVIGSGRRARDPTNPIYPSSRIPPSSNLRRSGASGSHGIGNRLTSPSREVGSFPSSGDYWLVDILR